MINFEIITRCNLRCPMCSKGGEQGKPYDINGVVMPLPVFKSIWDKIKNYTSTLVLVGQGETFVHPKVYDILEYVSPVPIYIDTNGNIKLEAERIINSSIQELVFSVDGIDQRSYEKYRIGGNFNKVIENFSSIVKAKKLYGRGPLITLKYILFKHTEAYLDDVKKLVDKLGVDRLRVVTCVVHPAHSESLIKELYPVAVATEQSRMRYVDYDNNTLGLNYQIDSPYCMAPFTNPQIKVNGNVTCCCSSFEVVGNIIENTLPEIWHSEKYLSLRKGIISNRYNYSDCRACSREQSNYGHLFDGTILEYPNPPEPGKNVLWMKDLKIDQDYLNYLAANGLTKEIKYFREANAISDEVQCS
jgi:MoaA/NifB/PqqE/SkfB family radical SAM enzyme